MAKTNSETKSRSKRAETCAIVAAEKAASAKELKSDVAKVCKGKVGQPTKFTPEKWELILTTVATYGDLIEVCQRSDMPSVHTIYYWMKENPELKDQMRSAWEMFSMVGHSVNNNILQGGVLSTGDFRRDEALVQNNRWFMGKTNRRDFGDKVQVDVVEHQPVIIDWNIIEGEGGDGV